MAFLFFEYKAKKQRGILRGFGLKREIKLKLVLISRNFEKKSRKKIIDLPRRQIIDPHSLLSFLQATPSSLFRTLERLFLAITGPTRALNLTLYVAYGTAEIQGHCQVLPGWV